MKKLLNIFLMIILTYSLCLTKVSAYYSNDRKLVFDLSSITKDSFYYSGNDKFYDDLITIDNYLKNSGLNYSIYVSVRYDVNINSYHVFSSSIFIQPTELENYNNFKISGSYHSSEFIRYYVGISNNNAFSNNSYTNTENFTMLTFASLNSRNNMNNVLNQITNNSYSPSSSVKDGDMYNYVSLAPVSYSTENNINYGTGEFLTVFSSSNDVTYFDISENALPIVYKAPNGEEISIERGDVIPQLITYFETPSEDGDGSSDDDNTLTYDFSNFYVNNSNISSIKDNTVINSIYTDFIDKIPSDYGYLLTLRTPGDSRTVNFTDFIAFNLYLFPIKHNLYQGTYKRYGYSDRNYLSFVSNGGSSIGYNVEYKKFELWKNYGTELYNNLDIQNFEDFLSNPTWNTTNNFYYDLHSFSDEIFVSTSSTRSFSINDDGLPYTLYYLPYLVSTNMDIYLNSHSYAYDIKVIDFEGNTHAYTQGDLIDYISLENLFTSKKISYTWLGNIHTTNDSPYVLDYELKKEHIEDKHTYNFKVTLDKASVNSPEINLYKVVGNDYVLVEDSEYITYTYTETTSDTYELIGSITFSDEVSYTNDYILRLKYSNINDTDIYFYADYALNQVYMRSAFLEDYRLYHFPKSHNYAFISSDIATSGTIYAENRYILNNTTNDNKRFNAYYFDYDRRDYLSRIMALKEDETYQKYNFELDYSKNKILVLKQFNASEKDSIGAMFWVHKDFTVSFADATLDFTPAILIKTPDGDINYNNYAWALEGDVANIDDEDVTSPIPDNTYENTDDLYNEASAFLEQIKYVIVPIFSLFTYFFENINPYIKNALISLFIIIIICTIVRKLFKS